MTETPTVMAMAAMSAAMVSELRCMARTRLREARRRAVPCGERFATAWKNFPANEVAAGTRKAKPMTTRKAAANPRMAGPVRRASHEAVKAAARATPPKIIQRAGSVSRCSITVPMCSAPVTSALAASPEGIHAATITADSPAPTAAAICQGPTESFSMLTRT